ncbi:hypothetical protein CHS0354_033927 [Potamilus streckersoni]|uniref:P/Homo B domain-containing protein n=1 Tax=Potamilus streckersoni TaxID=2493646 RepID=A0AAE0VLE0_9BIVA|nr:hypothetical protein CHS0354_033927 [Potamilus streckersoni]
MEQSYQSPMLTVSRLMTKRSKKPVSSSSINWTYMSVHFWDENPAGEWTLKIKYGIHHTEPIAIKNVALILYGTMSDENDKDIKDSPMEVNIFWIVILPIGLSIISVIICFCLKSRRRTENDFQPAAEQLQE